MTAVEERAEPRADVAVRLRLRRRATVALVRAPRAQRPAATGSATLVWTSVSLAGFLALFFALFGLGLSGLHESSAQHRLFAELREQLALATAPVGGAIPPGAPVALLSAPRAGLRDVVVVEGTTSSLLRSGPGHRRDTPLPGQAGVSVLYGRGTSYGRPFGEVPSLSPGDALVVTTAQGRFTYVVDGSRRNGDPLPTTLSVGAARLTLVTSDGRGVRALQGKLSTVFVDATLKGPAQPAPAGRPSALTAPEKAMAGDKGALVGLVLCLQLRLLHLLWCLT